ncbi:hypothetical protein [Cupriavidus sp. CuC1]|uniref:hypothetical protein n=1 Tax=Cupriavidus sp. CuC1 TaxID=3373131 RepID=UPI0037CCF828
MSLPSELRPFVLIRWQRRAGTAAADYRFVAHDAGSRLCCLYDLSQSERSRFPRLDIVPETVIVSAFGRALTVIHADPVTHAHGKAVLSQAEQQSWDRAWRIMRALLAPDAFGIGMAQGRARHAIFLDPKERRHRFVAVAARYRVTEHVVAMIFARFLRFGGTREAVRPRVVRCGGRVTHWRKSGPSPC